MTTTAFSSPEQAADGTRGKMRERAGRAALLGLLAAALAVLGLALPALAWHWLAAGNAADADFAGLFVAPVAAGLIFALIGAFAYRRAGGTAAGRDLALFGAAGGLALGGIFDMGSGQALAWVWAIAWPLAGAGLLRLALSFPHEAGPALRWPALRALAFAPALAVAAYTLAALYGPAAEAQAAATLQDASHWRAALIFVGISALVFVVSIVYRRAASASPVVRDQCLVALLGALGAVATTGGLALAGGRGGLAGGGGALLEGAAAGAPLLALFPASVAYALLRGPQLDGGRLMGQGLVYAGMLAFTLAAYGLILAGGSLLLGAALQASHPAALAALVFVMLAVFHPLRERLEALARAAFLRGARANLERLDDFSRGLTRATTLNDIVHALDAQVTAVMRPAHAYLFLRDGQTGEFAAFAPEPLNGAAPAAFAASDLRFAAGGALAAALAAHLAPEQTALCLTHGTPLPAALQGDWARLTLLGASIYAPLHGQAGLAGWLAIGPRLSGQALTRADLRFAQALADRSALAIERAASIHALEGRVRELNVLSQMSQAVNFTLAYDDLLELIYAQASKVMDTRNFTILLRDERGDGYRHAMVVENDERDASQEQHAAAGAVRGLESEILRSGQPILTDDYAAECRRRNLAPRSRAYRAWLGVPLNAGADTIGVMCAAGVDAEVSFSADQLRILWAMADQAASAIARARLYQKSEERARQLSTLNELSATLASNLALDPLLAHIVQTSMDILGCEAGSLFLTDEDSGEYVFRVAAGPVGHDLIGMRIARGKGFVGEAIETGQVLTVNDVQNDPRWFAGSDATTGFVTRALMVAPLRRGERTIGALEVINKRNELPFGDENGSLLAAFAGQATVAIVNAQLFAQTDQALAERVAELSMMQLIDRELNAALDVQRVMDITLDWAMKNTRATAGSVGMVTEAGIVIIATRGYSDTLEPQRDRPLSVEQGILGRVVRSGQMNLARDVRGDPDTRGALASTRSQLTIPMARENTVVGLVNLESPSPDAFSEAQVAFVTRLMDHASVAITNARLYAEVTAANIAKSEFVSVAAHELKTPMTSIKMSAELMLLGAVGDFNDTQRQFLNTIRTNLDRMTTVVSDLNDITRIETGRLLLETRPFHFQSVVDEVVRATREQVAAKQQSFEVELAPDLPAALGDPIRTTQVLTNLVTNANKYTPEQGRIVVRAEAEAQSGASGPGRLHVSVRDSGIGISPEDQKMLFDKFFRSEDQAAREMAPGTGLGLSIVKNLVELQGGRIWVESQMRQGSTFHFTLPLAPPETGS